MSVEVTWIHHASFRLSGSSVVYVDPWKMPGSPRDGNVVFVSHAHFDHCSPEDIRKVLAPDGVVVGPADAIRQTGAQGQVLRPGETVKAGGVGITGVPAYNVGKNYHPKSNQWLGAVVELDSVRIYCAGDTDAVPEMSALDSIDLALLPVGGTYTMTASQAARACADIGCKAAVPCHYGDVVGTDADARRFAKEAPCQVYVLAPGQSVTV